MNTRDNSICLVRTINASAGELFAAWTDPTLMRRWLAPEPCEGTAVEVDVDARVSGRYRIIVIGSGDVLVTAGEYRELVPGKRLVMTWSCGEPLAAYQDATTLVTVGLQARGARRTELTLIHSGAAAGDERGLREGWSACLDRLEALYAGDSRDTRQHDRAPSERHETSNP